MALDYAGSYGHIKALGLDLLGGEALASLSGASAGEFPGMLAATSYRQEFDSLSQMYAMPDLVEAVLNSHMVRMVRRAYMLLPERGRRFMDAYIGKWDTDNIKVVLSSKMLGYGLETTEAFLSVQRGQPVGVMGGRLSHEDYIKLIGLPDIKSAVAYLMGFGYGRQLVRFIGTGSVAEDVPAMINALDLAYYRRLAEALKGVDDAKVMGFVRGQIDLRNVMTAIKMAIRKMPMERALFMEGGTVAFDSLRELGGDWAEGLRRVTKYDVSQAVTQYKEDGMVSHVEHALRRELGREFLSGASTSVLSLGAVMRFTAMCEAEREELRLLWLGKFYGLEPGRLEKQG